MPPKRPELKEVKKKENTTQLKVAKRRRVRAVRCIAYANRTRRRLFTAKKIGDIVCIFLREQAASGPSGRSRSITQLQQAQLELRKELDRCFPCTESDNETTKKLRAAVAQAVAALQENSTLIVVAIAVLAALALLPRLIPQLPRVALALLPAVLQRTVTQIPALIARLRTQQAANDSLWRLIVGL